MKILSVTKYGNYYTVFHETDSYYIREDVFVNNIATTKYPREQYGDYDQFVNIMRKVEVGVKFLVEPVEIEDTNYDKVKRLYNMLSIQFGW
jgi:hypothetical protein